MLRATVTLLTNLLSLSEMYSPKAALGLPLVVLMVRKWFENGPTLVRKRCDEVWRKMQTKNRQRVLPVFWF